MRRRFNLPVYIVLAVIICLLLFIAYEAYPLIKDRFGAKEETAVTPAVSESDESTQQSDYTEEENSNNRQESENTRESENDSQREDETDVSGNSDTAGEESDDGYFGDALFIGDSRTIGLKDYAGLEGASYFATTGMSVFNISRETVDVTGNGALTLMEHLEEVRYGKIYLMLGVNELGYDMNAVFNKYKELLGKIIELQPDATVYIEANLHVVKAKSDSSNIYNNANIDKINSMISELADNKKIFYIDVNPLFDDGCGNLSEEYAYDATHVLGKYYKTWGDWIKTETANK